MTRSRIRPARRRLWAAVALLAALGVVVFTASGAAAASGSAAAGAPAQSGTITLTTTSGSITGTLGLGVTPATGAGVQTCDPANESFAVVYVAAVGQEYGVAGGSVNYTILAPEDGSLVPAGGTLMQFLPTVVPPAFPATGGNTPIDGKTKGTFSLGVRCQNDSSSQIFQNYWTTITINDGTWTVGGAVPTTSSMSSTSSTAHSGTPSSMTSSSASTSSASTSPASTSPASTSSASTSSATTTSNDTRSGGLTIAPPTGNLLTGMHTLTAVPAAGSGDQPCGDVQAFALLYFTPVGDEYQPAGTPGVVLKARPLQAAGLDIPVGGTLVDFLAAVGSVDFSQSLGASDSWQTALGAGKYSMGVRCQSGTASDPTIYQNYFSTVDVAADGTWRVEGAPTSTMPSPTPATTTAPRSTPTTPPVTLAVLDDAGHPLSTPITVKQGQRVFVSATGFAPSESVTVVIHSTPMTLATVNAVDGGIATQITIPATLPVGAHQLTFTGSSSHRTGNLDIAVTSAHATTTPSTRSTGSSTTTPTVTGTTTDSTTGSTSSTSGDVTTTYLTSSTGSVPLYPTATPTYPYSSSTGYANANNASADGGGGRTPGALAYTGYPASSTLDLSLLLLGSGIGVLALTAGFPTTSRRARPVQLPPPPGADARSCRDA